MATEKPRKRKPPNPKGTWKKGQSGNPKGRPKGVPNRATRELKAVLREYLESDEGRHRLYSLMASSERVYVWGCEMLYGKPRQTHDVTTHAGLTPEDAAHMRREVASVRYLVRTGTISEQQAVDALAQGDDPERDTGNA